ncbi:DUF4160 domain-containing protein [Candidatus Bipolaricaulota bacterium]|nr:DUF4160 domain-containing protein [Candidatus Bipolaricaulota bacterium]
MSPTVFRYKDYRFYFFSREEKRMHVHVYCTNGEAKFWIEPEVILAKNHGLSGSQITELTCVAKEHRDEIENAWKKHFPG